MSTEVRTQPDRVARLKDLLAKAGDLQIVGFSYRFRTFKDNDQTVHSTKGEVAKFFMEDEARLYAEVRNVLPLLLGLAEAVHAMREHMTGHYVSAEDMYVIDSLREALGLFDPEAEGK